MSATSSSATPANDNNGRRNFLLKGLAIIIAIAAVGYAVWYFLHGRWYENTDDAYAHGNIIEVTPLVSGTIVEISVDDNMLAKAGQSLVKFDPNDSRVALQQAEAALARSVRQVRGLYANVGGQSADLAVKQVALDRARADVERRHGLDVSGAISREDLAHTQAVLESAERALMVSREQLATTSALTDDTSIATHPEVKAAASVVRKAYLDYARSTLRASVTGYVTRRSAQLGQHVTTGTSLMALVPLDQLWVDANFKETQLEHMRIGQPVEVRSDLYGGDVIYHGRIASLGIGTGSSMSLLPAQNATGNWIKIVQRVPVRIALDAKELNEHPLRIGLSMHVEV
ncbi:MAG: efflux RND transporter periplasmic adaptor subunit, partial [Georgfuchsia sp.]